MQPAQSLTEAREERMFEFIYNFVLGGFSIYGAILLGRWILGRGWHWAAKAVALVFVASLVTSGVSLLVGGAKDDLRVFTEVLATAGAVIAVVAMMGNGRAGRSAWIRYGVPVALLLFLAITWREQIDGLRHGNIAASMPAIAPALTPVAQLPTLPVAPSPTRHENDLCSDPDLPYTYRKDLGCE